MNITGDAKLISSAFVKACGEMGAIVVEDAKGNFGKYATLAAVAKVTTAPLAKQGLKIVQESEVEDGFVMVHTTLLHESGATIQFSPLVLPVAQRTPQSVGSAITYARRYQLVSVCGLAPDDDDGQAAEDATRKAQQQAPKPQPPIVPKRQANRPEPSVDTDTDTMFMPDEPNNGPSDEELEVLGTWKDTTDAYKWAVDTGACNAIEHAKNSLKMVVARDFGGKFTTSNSAAVYLAVLRHWNGKIAAQEQAMQPELVPA